MILDRNQIGDLLDATRDPDEASRVAQQLPNVVSTVSALLRAAASGETEVESGTPASEAVEDLIQALRVLRNACAAGPAAAAAVTSAGAIDALGDVIDALGAGSAALNWVMPAVAAQLAVNLCNAGGATAATAVWSRLFPLGFTTLAHIDSLATQEATSLTLLRCCCVVDGAAAELTSPAGAPLLAAALHANHRLGAQEMCNSDLGLLMGYLIFHKGLLRKAFAAMAAAGEATGEGEKTSEGVEGASVLEELRLVYGHSLMLQELSAEAMHAPLSSSAGDENAAAALDGRPSPPSSSPFTTSGSVDPCAESMEFLMELIQHLAAWSPSPPTSAAAEQGKGGRGEEGENKGEGEVGGADARAEVLQNALHVLRDLAARDDDGLALVHSPGTTSSSPPPHDDDTRNSNSSAIDAQAVVSSPVAALVAGGAVRMLLGMLAALGPIQNPRRQAPRKPAMEESGLGPELTTAAESFAMRQPYQGYRSDILSGIANLAHQRAGVQSSVEALGGVELVLSQCQVDDTSPLAREWALWAVRNICQGSDTARQALRELKAVEALDSDELKAAGVKVVLDEATGKLRVEKRAVVEEEIARG